MVEVGAYKKGYEIHRFGFTNRMSADALLVDQINRVHEEFPGYRVALPGTSGVHGETIPLFRTQCEFTLANDEMMDRCLDSLRERDEINRKRPELLWTWEMVWTRATDVLFFVNWLDFAYFFKSRDAFLGNAHSRYTESFGLDVSAIQYTHFRIAVDGSQIEFVESDLTSEEKNVLPILDTIEFDRAFST
jgi:hypothetical protein